MERLSLTIDVTKVDKSKIVERRFTNGAGKEVIARDLKVDVVPLKEPKMIKDGGSWQMWKTHFVAIPQTKEERENKVKSVIVGDAIMFKNKRQEDAEEVMGKDDDIDVSQIPF